MDNHFEEETVNCANLTKRTKHRGLQESHNFWVTLLNGMKEKTITMNSYESYSWYKTHHYCNSWICARGEVQIYYLNI